MPLRIDHLRSPALDRGGLTVTIPTYAAAMSAEQSGEPGAESTPKATPSIPTYPSTQTPSVTPRTGHQEPLT